MDARRKPDRLTEAWALVSKNPQISRRELMAAMGLKTCSASSYWLRRLAEAGIVEIVPKQTRGVRVLIPLAVVGGGK